jgi:Cd2+/Zn2+-exporting ATPase
MAQVVEEFVVRGMDCADCARTLERGLARLEGVSACSVNFGTATLSATYDPARLDAAKLAARVRALGYELGADEAQPEVRPAGLAAEGHLASFSAFVRFVFSRRATGIPLGLGIALLLAGLLLEWRGHSQAGSLLAILALVVAGYPIALSGLRALLVGRQMTINLLMISAAIGAVIIGETSEAATLILLFTLGEALESFTAERSREALRGLERLAPAQASVLMPCLDCAEHLGQNGYQGGPCPFCGPHEQVLPVAQVQVGQTVLVKPGERIPLDGCITQGSSLVAQQHITGESIPVTRGVGDLLYAGSVNGDGALEIAVSSPASESLLSRIANLVAQAQARRAPVERFIDRFAAVYTPAVVVAAAALASLPPLLFGQPFWNTPSEQGWLYRALALLVVACPCALVISTPVSIVSALVAAARQGVLVKGGAALEALRQVRIFAFDKTGTLTRGQPQVTGMHCADGCCESLALPTRQASRFPSADCAHCDDLLALAAAVERRSAHPLASAVLAAADARALRTRYSAAENVRALPGRGLVGTVAGRQVRIGSQAFFDAEHVYAPALCAQVVAAEAVGQTALLVCACDEGAVCGYLTVADTPRPESRQALADLKAAGIARTVMLTGDNAGVGQAIGAQVGVDEVWAGLLPHEKLAAVESLHEQYGAVAMVGDGVNDTPALAAASVGIAMGAAGSAQALQTADIALLGDDLSKLPFLVRLSQQTGRIIRQNIGISLLSKLAFVLLAMGGWATLWLAVIADMGISLLVTLNGARLLGQRATDRA